MDTTVSYITSLMDQTNQDEDINTSDTSNTTLSEYSNVTQAVGGGDGGAGGGGLTDYHRYLLNQSENLMTYMSPVLIVVGTLGNVTSIIILCSARFKKAPSSMMMIILALVDTGNLNTGLLRHWVRYRFSVDMRALTTAGCKAHFFATYLFGCMCGWSLALLTLERTVSVLYPLRARQICSRKNMTIAFIIVTVLLFLANSHLLYFSRLYDLQYYDSDIDQMVNYSQCKVEEKHYDLVMDILYWQDMLLSSAVPSGLIFIGNALIIYRLTIAQIKRRKNMNVDSSKQAGVGSINLMLIVISLMFLITTLPITIYFFQLDIWFDRDTLDGRVKAHFTHSVVTMFFYGNNMINFWLYFLSGRKFRQTFVAIFCPCRKQAPQSTPMASSLSQSGTAEVQTTSKF